MSHVNKEGQVVKSFVTHEGNLVYPVTHNLVDLFWGVGFVNQARFKWNPKGRTGEGEWALWSKTSSLPKGFINSLEFYRSSIKELTK